jgi:hypothetical protein
MYDNNKVIHYQSINFQIFKFSGSVGANIAQSYPSEHKRLRGISSQHVIIYFGNNTCNLNIDQVMFNIAINRGCKLFILFMRSLFGAANKPHHLYIPGNRFKTNPTK